MRFPSSAERQKKVNGTETQTILADIYGTCGKLSKIVKVYAQRTMQLVYGK